MHHVEVGVLDAQGSESAPIPEERLDDGLQHFGVHLFEEPLNAFVDVGVVM